MGWHWSWDAMRFVPDTLLGWIVYSAVPLLVVLCIWAWQEIKNR